MKIVLRCIKVNSVVIIILFTQQENWGITDMMGERFSVVQKLL